MDWERYAKELEKIIDAITLPDDRRITVDAFVEQARDKAEGGQDADQHTHWIPVEEERPKFDWKDDGSWSSSLPILIYSIHGISIGTFQLDHMTGKSYWFFDGSKHEEFAGEWRIITHWMPLPTPPRKEE